MTFPPSLGDDKSIQCKSMDEEVIFFSSGSCKFRFIGLGTTDVVISSLVDKSITGTVQVTVRDPDIPETYVDVNPSDMASHRDRMYIKIRFEVSSSTEDIELNQGGAIGIHGIEVQGTGYGYELINKDISDQGYARYGYCVKYGCNSKIYLDSKHQRIARSSQGIDYYVGNNQLYTPIKNSGTTNFQLYTIPYIATASHYVRENLVYPVPFDQYDPSKHANAAKFTIKIVDRNPSVIFDGFDDISILPKPDPEPSPPSDEDHPSQSSSEESSSSENTPEGDSSSAEIPPQETDPEDTKEPVRPESSSESSSSEENNPNQPDGENSKKGDPAPGLGTGPVIGIIAAAVVVVGAIVVVVIVLIKKRSKVGYHSASKVSSSRQF